MSTMHSETRGTTATMQCANSCAAKHEGGRARAGLSTDSGVLHAAGRSQGRNAPPERRRSQKSRRPSGGGGARTLQHIHLGRQAVLTDGARLARLPSSLSAPARACHFRPCSVPASSRPVAALTAWALMEATRAAPAAPAASLTALTCRKVAAGFQRLSPASSMFCTQALRRSSAALPSRGPAARPRRPLAGALPCPHASCAGSKPQQASGTTGNRAQAIAAMHAADARVAASDRPGRTSGAPRR